MMTRQAKTLSLQVETLEGRVTPSDLALAAAPAAEVTTQQSGVTVTSATVDAKTGIVTITGTCVTNPFPFPSSTTVVLTQAVGRKDAVTSSTSPFGGGTTVVCDPDGNFEVTLAGTNGAFKPGDAILAVTTFDPVIFQNRTELIPLRLTNSHSSKPLARQDCNRFLSSPQRLPNDPSVSSPCHPASRRGTSSPSRGGRRSIPVRRSTRPRALQAARLWRAPRP
jgi:hypothetical protein